MKDIWETRRGMFWTPSKASVDAYGSQYHILRMKPNEKVMQYVNHLNEVENKLKAVDHTVTGAEQKRVLLRGPR